MLVRLLIGRYAGEVRDVFTPVARQMVADGRAEDVRNDPPRRRSAKRKPTKRKE